MGVVIKHKLTRHIRLVVYRIGSKIHTTHAVSNTIGWVLEQVTHTCQPPQKRKPVLILFSLKMRSLPAILMRVARSSFLNPTRKPTVTILPSPRLKPRKVELHHHWFEVQWAENITDRSIRKVSSNPSTCLCGRKSSSWIFHRRFNGSISWSPPPERVSFGKIRETWISILLWLLQARGRTKPRMVLTDEVRLIFESDIVFDWFVCGKWIPTLTKKKNIYSIFVVLVMTKSTKVVIAIWSILFMHFKQVVLNFGSFKSLSSCRCL